jgi:hypothetical protein
VLTLPDPDATIEVQWGSSLSVDSCTDALTGLPVVDGSALAVGGTVAYTIRPDLSVPLPAQPPFFFSADVDLELDLELADPTTGQLRPLRVRLEDVNVGGMGH